MSVRPPDTGVDARLDAPRRPTVGPAVDVVAAAEPRLPYAPLPALDPAAAP